MATYNLLNRWVNEIDPQIVVTKIEYTFDNGQKSTVDVHHFDPKTPNEMEVNVKQAGVNEWGRLARIASANQKLTALDQYIGVPRPFSQT